MAPRKTTTTRKAVVTTVSPDDPVKLLPGQREFNERQALGVIDLLAETGDLKSACAKIRATPAEFMFWARQRAEWAAALVEARKMYAEVLNQKVIGIAEERIPWDDWDELEVSEKNLRMQAFFRRQENRMRAAQSLADRMGPKKEGPGSVVQINNDARSESYGSRLAMVEADSRRKTIEGA